MINDPIWFWLTVPAALLIYELFAVTPLRRRLSRSIEMQHSLGASVQEATALAVEVFKTNRALRVRLEAVEDRLGQVELASAGRPYDQAISLAEQGEGAERLASRFGLTMGEANLVSLLHGQDPGSEPQVPREG